MKKVSKFLFIFIFIFSSLLSSACTENIDDNDDVITDTEGSSELSTEEQDVISVISFDSNGGSEIDLMTARYNESINAPEAPVKEGYLFEGWYRDVNLTVEFIFDSMPKESITLYAKWIEDPNYIWVVDKESRRVALEEHIQDAITEMYNFYDEPDPFYVLPSVGDVNILVVPIQFSTDKYSTNELEMLSYGFFGDGSSFETVKSYYHKSSHGKLNLNGEILEPYTAANTPSYYENYTSNYNQSASGVDLLIEEAITYYSTKYPELDLSDYDHQGDAYIDAIHFVYSVPMSYDDESIYWAYQYYYNATGGTDISDYYMWDELDVDTYVFSSIDFFYEDGITNAWTLIHETGHLFGIEDYYDYTYDEDDNRGGLGGADMMDDTRGDHNPFSKLLLDWIDPIVVSDSVVIKIDSFEQTGDTIILDDDFNSIFSEYIMLSYYTPTGLNTENRYFTEPGLVMYHVNAILPEDYDYIDQNSYYFEYNNSSSSEKFIRILEADYDNSIEETAIATNDDLLQLGESFVINEAGLSILIKVLEITDQSITIEINY